MTAAAGLPDTELVQTHTACLLLTGSHVLKWKKPVDLGFVDFRRREARLSACRAEVALNSRLAPDVYLGVGEVHDPEGRPCEPYVLMRRMPAALRLSTLVLAGQDVTGHIDAIARTLADFHSRCEVPADAEDVASAGRLRELWDDALVVLARHLPQRDLDRAVALLEHFLTGRGPLLAERAVRGYVRDGHGDLLADDIFCLPDGPRILDCLDFAPELRCGDVVGDVAFLAMDLEHLGAPAVARRLWERYREFSGETHPVTLEFLYTAYRAAVRAKVACVRAEQLPASERSEQLDQAASLFELSLRYLERTRVQLILVGGLPASGSSTLAAALADHRGPLLHSSDLVRHELFGVAPASAPYEGTMYSAQPTARVYAVLLERARTELERGHSVVLDASWSRASHRQAARELATDTRSELVELDCRVPDAVAESRLAQRAPTHPSDADAAVRSAMRSRAEPWPTAHVIDTAGPVQTALDHALRFMDAGTEERPS